VRRIITTEHAGWLLSLIIHTIKTPRLTLICIILAYFSIVLFLTFINLKDISSQKVASLFQQSKWNYTLNRRSEIINALKVVDRIDLTKFKNVNTRNNQTKKLGQKLLQDKKKKKQYLSRTCQILMFTSIALWISLLKTRQITANLVFIQKAIKQT